MGGGADWARASAPREGRVGEAVRDAEADAVVALLKLGARVHRGSRPWGTRFTGKDAVRKGLAMRFEATPDVHYSDDRHWVSGSMGVSEWLLTGTTRGGDKVEVRGCDHYEFRNGRVIRKDSYWKIVE